jgi:HAD superfamily hydrolase (TIGR01457 family)
VTRSDVAAVRGFIIDLDGTMYVGDRLIAGAPALLSVLAASRRPFVFVTNNSSASASSYGSKLRALGLDVADTQVFTSGEATAMFVRRCGWTSAYVVGTPSLEQEFERAGIAVSGASPACVVLGFDRTLTYAKLERAARLIGDGVPFIATHPDLVCPSENGYVPDCGSMIALLEAATGVKPTVVGKPEPLLVEMALAKLDLPAQDVAVVGDRLYTDMAMARRAGTRAVLVLSGETTRASLAVVTDPPDFVFEHVGVLAEALEGRRGDVARNVLTFGYR